MLTVHAASLANRTLSSTDSLIGSQNGDNIPFYLCTEERSHIIPETSGFGWFWIKVYFPIEVVLSHAKYFLAWVQLAISHCSVQFTGFVPVATSPWPEGKHAMVVAGKALPQLWLCRGVPTERPALALCCLYRTGAQLLASYWRGITVKGRLRIKLRLYLQELLGKNIAIDRDVVGFDQRKKPSNNSNALTLSQLVHWLAKMC